MRSVRGASRYINDLSKSGPRFGVGLCKRKCREAYQIPSDGSVDAKAAYAKTRHRFKHQWVAGAFAWWSNDGHWHVAICQYRKGWIWTTDLLRPGRWDSVRIEDVHKLWPNCTFVGFSRDIEGRTPVRKPLITRRWP